MRDDSEIAWLKEISSRIAGHWYCEELKQYFIFDFNTELLRDAKLTVINTKKFETTYGIAVLPGSELNGKPKFYFDVGRSERRYYEIMSVTKDTLIIREFFMVPNTEPFPPKTYVRQTNLNTADEILKGLNFT